MWLKTIDRMAILYFFNTSPDMILNGKILYKNYPRDMYEKLARSYDRDHSETENDMIYDIMQEQINIFHEKNESNLNVFFDLVHVAESLLSIRNNDIQCRYMELRRWREITRYLGEDMVVCAYFARRFQNIGVDQEWFGWDTVIGNTNQQLNALLKEGISDNHFHLFGSAPAFHLIWLKLMNNSNLSRYIAGLNKFDHNKRNMQYHFDIDYQEIPLEDMIMEAALLRVTMYIFLNHKQYIFTEVVQNFDENTGDLFGYLTRGSEIRDIQPEIRQLINSLKSELQFVSYGREDDYALANVKVDTNPNWIFSGERKLVYDMLCDILVKNQLPEFVQNMLYPYLTIRARIRGEIIQNNDMLGFDNFSVYSKRKNSFLANKKDISQMVYHAVISSFKHSNLKSLEIRLSPEDTYLQDAKLIKSYDDIITASKEVDKNCFFYVFHFAKKPEKSIAGIEDGLLLCRDYFLRKKVSIQGNAIIKLRERMPAEGERVHGIDACAQEIGCRAEVFAPMFRQLSKHITSFRSGECSRQLKITYHVGEDFLDMVDGLRAIDEAVRFLNMEHGDRLGHATVLGLSASDWYARKHNYITLAKQDYLDNIVWMYHKMLEYELDGFDILKDLLLNRFKSLYRYVYGKDIGVDVADDIYVYYSAWMLRGDKPELYRNGYYQSEQFLLPGELPINVKFPKNPNIRKNKDVTRLYYEYHYNYEVRKRGMESIEVEISNSYIKLVEEIQSRMRDDVAHWGIGIETNPSSNLLISTMLDYDEHPIVNLYNQGLKRKQDDYRAQLFVSINTDDKGVFNTSLENEYALMASALENMTDENGQKMYSPQEVYEWIDRVRKLGNQQIFS